MKAFEFDCIECGRHIFVICGPQVDVCSICKVIPGWWHDPSIVHVIDPNNIRNPKPVN